MDRGLTALGTLSRCFCPSFTLVSKPKGQAWGWDGPQGGTGCPGAPACSPSTLSLVPGPQTWCQHIKPGPNTPNLAPTPQTWPQHPTPTFSSATWELTCHMRLSLRNFIPYGPMSSANARISAGTETGMGTSQGDRGDEPPHCPLHIPHLKHRRTQQH